MKGGQANLRMLDAWEEAEMLSSRATHAVGRTRAEILQNLDQELRRRARRAWRIDAALQTALALLTLVAIGLLGSGSEYARWGHVVGLLSQPFYVAASWRARQWGMLIVALALVALWARGIVTSFF